MIKLDPTDIIIGNNESLLNSRLMNFKFSSSGSISFTAYSGSYIQEVSLGSNTYLTSARDIYIVSITPTSASSGSLAAANYIGKKFQLNLALPIDITTNGYRLAKYDILTCRLLPTKLQFQAYNALNLASTNPITTTSISFTWDMQVFSYE
jgi:hypothetical protein